jgi:ectoine hydroxylase
MSIKETFKKYKFLHKVYNLLHLKQLQHNKEAYDRYHVHKPLYGSISSKDFPDKASVAWLDVSDSSSIAEKNSAFNQFSEEIKTQIKNWSANGYMTVNNYVSNQQVDEINNAVDELINVKHLPITYDNKLMFGFKQSPVLKTMMQDEGLIKILSFILGKEVVPFQTLNFIKGSGQRAHSDSIHMTTYPLGYLIAVWIALEDIDQDSGPLFYFPGSHKLPYLLNDDFENYSTKLMLGKKEYTDYEDMIEEVLSRSSFEKKVFLPKKGDVLIWHANLVHGGVPVANNDLTRKSMVIHYYAKDVVKYHEITERPSLMEE